MSQLSALEPKNGDFVQYIDDLQAGKIKELAALKTGEIKDDGSGMITVKSNAELALEREAELSEKRKSRAAQTKLIVRLCGPVLGLSGLLTIVGGILSEFDQVIPIGMFLIFGGFVLFSQSRH